MHWSAQPLFPRHRHRRQFALRVDSTVCSNPCCDSNGATAPASALPTHRHLAGQPAGRRSASRGASRSRALSVGCALRAWTSAPRVARRLRHPPARLQFTLAASAQRSSNSRCIAFAAAPDVRVARTAQAAWRPTRGLRRPRAGRPLITARLLPAASTIRRSTT